MKLRKCSRSPLIAAIGFLFAGLAVTTSATPAAAQMDNAAQQCTPDVMRLCSEFIPDRGRIAGCLRARRSQLSPGCRIAMSPKAQHVSSQAKSKKKKKRHSHRS